MTDKHEDDQGQPQKQDPEAAGAIDADDSHKVEKLTKAGREEIDPDKGSD